MSTNQIAELARIRKLARTGDARRLRLEASISLRELAEMMTTAPANLSRWETGVHRPRRGAALRWAAVLRKLERATS